MGPFLGTHQHRFSCHLKSYFWWAIVYFNTIFICILLILTTWNLRIFWGWIWKESLFLIQILMEREMGGSWIPIQDIVLADKKYTHGAPPWLEVVLDEMFLKDKTDVISDCHTAAVKEPNALTFCVNREVPNLR